jgi:hypothetical protein
MLNQKLKSIILAAVSVACTFAPVPALAQTFPIVLLGETSEGDTLAYNLGSTAINSGDGVMFAYLLLDSKTKKIRQNKGFTFYCSGGNLSETPSKFYPGLNSVGWLLVDDNDPFGEAWKPIAATSQTSKLLLQLVCTLAK